VLIDDHNPQIPEQIQALGGENTSGGNGSWVRSAGRGIEEAGREGMEEAGREGMEEAGRRDGGSRERERKVEAEEIQAAGGEGVEEAG